MREPNVPHTVCMVNLAVWGLLLASLLFLAPSFIFLNVGFRCSRLLSSSDVVNKKPYCDEVDEELSYVLIGGGFIFLLFALATLAFTLIVCLNSRHLKQNEHRSLTDEEISNVWGTELRKETFCARSSVRRQDRSLSRVYDICQSVYRIKISHYTVEWFKHVVSCNYHIIMRNMPTGHGV